MSEALELPVSWNGTEIVFPMEMIRWGYTHRFKITVNETEYLFEPDEEGQYRAIMEEQSKGMKHPLDLLRAIGDTLYRLMG